jgi:hypothetical protein
MSVWGRKLRVRVSASFSIVFALFTAPIGLPGVSFLFFDVTVVQLLFDCEELRNRMLPAGVSLNIGVGDTFAEIGNSLAIVLRTIFALCISCVLAGHVVDQDTYSPPLQAAQFL